MPAWISGGHVGELEADALEAADRLAELLADAGVLERLLVRAFRDAERQGRDADASGVERLQEVDEALARPAEHVLLGHHRILEDQLARVAGPPAHLVFLLTRADAADLGQIVAVADAERRGTRSRSTVSLRDDEAGDAAVAGARLGARGDGEDLADAGVGDEGLRAVEDVVVALVDRGSGGAAGVAAGARLGEAEAAEHAAGGQQRDVLAALLVGAELDDRATCRGWCGR